MSFTSPTGSVSIPGHSSFVTSAARAGEATTESTQDEAASFVDRRGSSGSTATPGERRQFGSSHSGLTEDGRELATAIDRYKLEHHRRYITCDEMLAVLRTLGYERIES